MEPWDLERVRRSVAMLPEGHSAGALTKEMAEELIGEVTRLEKDNQRYRDAVSELKRVVEALDPPAPER